MPPDKKDLVIGTILELALLSSIFAISLLMPWLIMTRVLRLPAVTALVVMVPTTVLTLMMLARAYPAGWRRRHVEGVKTDSRRLLSNTVQLLGFASVVVYLAAAALFLSLRGQLLLPLMLTLADAAVCAQLLRWTRRWMNQIERGDAAQPTAVDLEASPLAASLLPPEQEVDRPSGP
jgi:hypothetical protein